MQHEFSQNLDYKLICDMCALDSLVLYDDVLISWELMSKVLNKYVYSPQSHYRVC